jgi:hypothetical protein
MRHLMLGFLALVTLSGPAVAEVAIGLGFGTEPLGVSGIYGIQQSFVQGFVAPYRYYGPYRHDGPYRERHLGVLGNFDYCWRNQMTPIVSGYIGGGLAVTQNNVGVRVPVGILVDPAGYRAQFAAELVPNLMLAGGSGVDLMLAARVKL